RGSDEEPRHDLRTPPAAEAGSRAQTVLVHGQHGPPATLPRALVTPEAEVEDEPAAVRFLRHVPSSGSPSVRNSARSPRRRGAIRRNGAPDATSASRIAS